MTKSKRYLLDTQIFIWWMGRHKSLKKGIEALLSDPDNRIFLSVVNIWEIVIKKRTGKLRPPRNWKQTLVKGGFEIIPISLEHVFNLGGLPLYHKDPFDRMLVAQARVEKCVLITADPKVKKYKVNTVS